MRQFSLARTHGTLLECAVLTAGILQGEAGFRPRDVAFFFELFGNWLEEDRKGKPLSIEIVQIIRHLKQQGEAKVVTSAHRAGRPFYKLTRPGALHLVATLVENSRALQMHEVVFISYVLTTYGDLIRAFLMAGAGFLSSAEKARLQHLLDPRSVVSHQLGLQENIIRDLEQRIAESDEMVTYAQTAQSKGSTQDDILTHLSRHFGYQLSHRKPLRELLSGLPAPMREFEMLQGMRLRNEALFRPLLHWHAQMRDALTQLL